MLDNYYVIYTSSNHTDVTEDMSYILAEQFCEYHCSTNPDYEYVIVKALGESLDVS